MCLYVFLFAPVCPSLFPHVHILVCFCAFINIRLNYFQAKAFLPGPGRDRKFGRNDLSEVTGAAATCTEHVEMTIDTIIPSNDMG